ncbi:Phosphoglycolate phosphatase [Roseovarius sp. THAF27]|nr:Phosphoglycolate phosphatase [Roseovarius sp. THAF27]QFT97339.1 Phosphoglycolate phosphatase [Roseovarius sp. THAF8]
MMPEAGSTSGRRSRAVIFDLDGTLIDSAPDIHAAANRVLAGHGIAPFTLAEARGFVGHGAAAFVRRCLAARGLDDDSALQAQVLQQFLDVYEGAVHLTQPYPGVTACLDALDGAGVALGICTNKPEGPTASVLAHLDLARYFSVIVGGDTLSVRKPDPAPLLRAISQTGSEEVIFVGDSEVDAETSRTAGVPFALFTEGYRKTPVDDLPQAGRFSQFASLPALVDRVLGDRDAPPVVRSGADC